MAIATFKEDELPGLSTPAKHFDGKKCSLILKNFMHEEYFGCAHPDCISREFDVAVVPNEDGIQAHITCAKCGCEHFEKYDTNYLADYLYKD